MLKDLVFTIEGRPMTKKNGLRKARGGKILPSAYFEKYQRAAVAQLKTQKQGDIIYRPCLLEVQYYMESRTAWPDLIGLIQGTQDILQEAEIIFDDRQIVGYTPNTMIAGIAPHDAHTVITLHVLYEEDDELAYTLDPKIIKWGKEGKFNEKK